MHRDVHFESLQQAEEDTHDKGDPDKHGRAVFGVEAVDPCLDIVRRQHGARRKHLEDELDARSDAGVVRVEMDDEDNLPRRVVNVVRACQIVPKLLDRGANEAGGAVGHGRARQVRGLVGVAELV